MRIVNRILPALAAALLLAGCPSDEERAAGGAADPGAELPDDADGGSIPANPFGDAPTFRLTMIPVGFGDALLLEFPNGKTMMLDAGDPVVGPRAVRAMLRDKAIERIDYLVISHPHVDHYGGAGFLAENYPIGEFWTNGAETGDAGYGALLRLLDEKGVPGQVVREGDVFDIGGVAIETLHGEAGYPDANNNSLVLRLTHGSNVFLFAGDIETEAGAQLAAELGAGLRADFLKIPHHGVKYANLQFLIETAPAIAAVSCPPGMIGLPSSEIIELLTSLGADFYPTAESPVFVFSDGSGLETRGAEPLPPRASEYLLRPDRVYLATIDYAPAEPLAESLTLANGGESVSLAGWSIELDGDPIVVFGEETLAAGGRLKIFTGEGVAAPGELYLGLAEELWEDEGPAEATLINAAGAKIDVYRYKVDN